MPFRGSFTLLRVKGVPIRLHWTLLLVLVPVAIVLSADFPEVAAAAGVPVDGLLLPPLLWGGMMAVLLFASVAIHELAHTLVALRAGSKVYEITLMFIGGVSQVARIPSQRVETLMAAAGPATSLALGALLLVGHASLPADTADLRLGMFYLGHINFVLGLFNLLPAFPMDGGRILRGLLAGRLGAVRATSVAARVGQVLALLMAVLSLVFGNFLLLIVAIFVYAGASQEALAEETRSALEGLRVADIMRPRPPAVALQTPMAILAGIMRGAGSTEVVVVDDCAHPLGLVRATDLARLPPAQRSKAAVGDLGEQQLTRFTVQVSQDESALAALERADQAGAEYVIAVDEAAAGNVSTLTGLFGPRDIEKALLLRSLENERRPRGAVAARSKSLRRTTARRPADAPIRPTRQRVAGGH